jgi:hypothetical protein
MAALPHISAIAKRIIASLEFRCGDARFIPSNRRANGQVLRIIGFGPFLETETLSAIVWRAGADAITAAIENDPLKASQRELFQLEALRHSNCSRPGLCNGTPCD